MGRTKTKIIDDAQVEEPTKSSKPARRLRLQDDLVEKLKAELGGEIVGEKEVKTEPLRPEVVKTTPAVSKKAQKPGKTKPRSEKYQDVVKDLDKSKVYPLTEAIELTKKLSYSKITGTLEAHINTTNTGIRGLVSLPFVSGKKLRILAFGPSSAATVKTDEESGITLGNDQTIEEINKGKVNFDLVVTTPEWMPKLAKVARILGPRGLMPNPKNGTITADLKKTIEGFQGGKTEYKTESKAPVIHLGLGKLNQPTEQLSANIKILLQTLGKTKVKKVSLSPTMGPSVKLDLTSL